MCCSPTAHPPKTSESWGQDRALALLLFCTHSNSVIINSKIQAITSCFNLFFQEMNGPLAEFGRQGEWLPVLLTHVAGEAWELLHLQLVTALPSRNISPEGFHALKCSLNKGACWSFLPT